MNQVNPNQYVESCSEGPGLACWQAVDTAPVSIRISLSVMVDFRLVVFCRGYSLGGFASHRLFQGIGCEQGVELFSENRLGCLSQVLSGSLRGRVKRFCLRLLRAILTFVLSGLSAMDAAEQVTNFPRKQDGRVLRHYAGRRLVARWVRHWENHLGFVYLVNASREHGRAPNRS